MKCAWNTMKILYWLSFLVFHTCYSNFIFFFVLPIKEIFNFTVYGIYLILLVHKMSGREQALWCPSRTDYVRPFPVNRWKGCVRWGKIWKEKVFLCRQSRQFCFDLINASTFPFLSLDLECKPLCFCQGKGINRRNESTKRHKNYTDDFTQESYFQKLDSSIFPFVVWK